MKNDHSIALFPLAPPYVPSFDAALRMSQRLFYACYLVKIAWGTTVADWWNADQARHC